ncbi:unnamed protein product, partial [Adineta ricciae]
MSQQQSSNNNSTLREIEEFFQNEGMYQMNTPPSHQQTLVQDNSTSESVSLVSETPGPLNIAFID